jgi:hypothetical protein
VGGTSAFFDGGADLLTVRKGPMHMTVRKEPMQRYQARQPTVTGMICRDVIEPEKEKWRRGEMPTDENRNEKCPTRNAPRQMPADENHNKKCSWCDENHNGEMPLPSTSTDGTPTHSPFDENPNPALWNS